MRYGDFPAHDALWQMAERTKDDVVARIALVPRTLEARGLDASPGVRRRLLAAGDAAGAAIVDVILADEIGHVAIGNRWFAWLCERDRLATRRRRTRASPRSTPRRARERRSTSRRAAPPASRPPRSTRSRNASVDRRGHARRTSRASRATAAGQARTLN